MNIIKNVVYLAKAHIRGYVPKDFVLRVVLGRIRWEFVQTLIEKYGLRQDFLNISLYVTSKCQLNCEHCIMMNLMKDHRSYQMSLDEVRLFIDASEKSGYKFNIVLTGGEPLVWRNLKEGLRLLRASKACGRITMFSNAMYIESVDQELVGLLDSIRISRYRDNGENIITLKERFSDKVSLDEVDRQEFWANPTEAVPNALPVNCLNPELMLYDHQVFACPHSKSIAIGNGSTIKLSNPLEIGFIKGLADIKTTYHTEVCNYCISNGKVREQLSKEVNFCARDVKRRDKASHQQALPIIQ